MIKKISLLLLAGLVVLLGTVLFMQFVSLNMSYVVILCCVFLYLSAHFTKRIPVNTLLKVSIISAPIILGFYFLIVPELPGLWVVLPLFLLSSYFGCFDLKSKIGLISMVGLFAITLYLSFKIVPSLISNELFVEQREASPDFQLMDLDNDLTMTKSQFKNKIVVLDFFGTWCRPCIAEMKELEKVKQHFKTRSDIEFAMVCTDTGKDTPEKAIKFKEKRNLSFSLYYDKGSESHKDFGFSGVPALVIIDKSGEVRLKHEGYNEAENLKDKLISIIDSLKIE